MHIPDGYLSPQTCAVATAVMVPVWGTAAHKVRQTIKRREVPLLALAASYSFLVMMLNVPIPDGTTAHAMGAVLIAILLGPWAAVIAVSVALLIQAMFFGDGGVLAFGANAFNIAFVAPFLGYGVYKLISRKAPLTSGRRVVAAGVGAYVGINAAALAAAIEFGIQPDLFTASDGTPLYAPFHLAQTIPAMALAHLTIAGGVETALTAGVFGYLQRNNVPVLRINRAALPPAEQALPVGADGEPTGLAGEPIGLAGEPTDDGTGSPGALPVASTATARPRSPWRWAAVGIVLLALLTPLGLLSEGGAFGEDAPGELDLGRYGLDAVPEGLDRYNGFWSHALLGDYGFSSGDNATLAYLLSAAVGVVIVSLTILFILLVARVVRRDRPGDEAPPASGPDAAALGGVT